MLGTSDRVSTPFLLCIYFTTPLQIVNYQNQKPIILFKSDGLDLFSKQPRTQLPDGSWLAWLGCEIKFIFVLIYSVWNWKQQNYLHLNIFLILSVTVFRLTSGSGLYALVLLSNLISLITGSLGTGPYGTELP